jgi:hypothetical protein
MHNCLQNSTIFLSSNCTRKKTGMFKLQAFFVFVFKHCFSPDFRVNKPSRKIFRGKRKYIFAELLHMNTKPHSFQLNHGVRPPKFIWALCECAQLYSLAETRKPHSPPTPHPPAFGLIYDGAMGQPRKTTSLCAALNRT